MAGLPEIKSCDDVDAHLLDEAFAPASSEGLRPRERVLRLLERMARVATPGASAHKILEVLARLAQMDDLDGTLDVVIREFGLASEFEVRIDRGARFERIRTLSLAVPMAELAEWAHENPDALRPLGVFGIPTMEELRLRILSPAEGEADEDDPHRRDTARIRAVTVPPEAYRPPMATLPERRPTIPVPRPEPIGVETEKDPTDEGWDE